MNLNFMQMFNLSGLSRCSRHLNQINLSKYLLWQSDVFSVVNSDLRYIWFPINIVTISAFWQLFRDIGIYLNAEGQTSVWLDI